MHRFATSDIQPLALALLRQSPISALHNLDVHADDTTIIISGKLPTYHWKQLAQHQLLPLAGKWRIVNNIRVSKPRMRAADAF